MYALRILTGIAAVLVLLDVLLLGTTASIVLHLRHMVRTGDDAPYAVDRHGLYYVSLLCGRLWVRLHALLPWRDFI